MTNNNKAIITETLTILDYKQAELKLTLYSAYPIETSDVNKIAQILTKKYNFVAKTVEVIIDPDLIGGIKAVFDSNVIDGTVKGKLGTIKRNSEERI